MWGVQRNVGDLASGVGGLKKESFEACLIYHRVV